MLSQIGETRVEADNPKPNPRGSSKTSSRNSRNAATRKTSSEQVTSSLQALLTACCASLDREDHRENPAACQAHSVFEPTFSRIHRRSLCEASVADPHRRRRSAPIEIMLSQKVHSFPGCHFVTPRFSGVLDSPEPQGGILLPVVWEVQQRGDVGKKQLRRQCLHCLQEQLRQLSALLAAALSSSTT